MSRELDLEEALKLEGQKIDIGLSTPVSRRQLFKAAAATGAGLAVSHYLTKNTKASNIEPGEDRVIAGGLEAGFGVASNGNGIDLHYIVRSSDSVGFVYQSERETANGRVWMSAYMPLNPEVDYLNYDGGYALVQDRRLGGLSINSIKQYDPARGLGATLENPPGIYPVEGKIRTVSADNRMFVVYHADKVANSQTRRMITVGEVDGGLREVASLFIPENAGSHTLHYAAALTPNQDSGVSKAVGIISTKEADGELTTVQTSFPVKTREGRGPISPLPTWFIDQERRDQVADYSVSAVSIGERAMRTAVIKRRDANRHDYEVKIAEFGATSSVDAGVKFMLSLAGKLRAHTLVREDERYLLAYIAPMSELGQGLEPIVYRPHLVIEDVTPTPQPEFVERRVLADQRINPTNLEDIKRLDVVRASNGEFKVYYQSANRLHHLYFPGQ